MPRVLDMMESRVAALCSSYFEVEAGMYKVRRALPRLIDKLKGHVEQGHLPADKKRATVILSQALQLRSLTHCHILNFGFALQDAQSTLDYALGIEHADLQAIGHIRQGEVYFYLRRPAQRYIAYDRAMKIIDHISSPAIRARVILGFAESCAATGLEVRENFLEEAEQCFPAHPEQDPSYAYTHLNKTAFAVNCARCLIAASKFDEALALLSKSVQSGITPDTVEVLSERARAHCLQAYRQHNGDTLEQACREVERLTSLAKWIGSDLRASQAQDCYETLLKSDYRSEVVNRLHLSVFDG